MGCYISSRYWSGTGLERSGTRSGTNRTCNSRLWSCSCSFNFLAKASLLSWNCSAYVLSLVQLPQPSSAHRCWSSQHDRIIAKGIEAYSQAFYPLQQHLQGTKARRRISPDFATPLATLMVGFQVLRLPWRLI